MASKPIKSQLRLCFYIFLLLSILDGMSTQLAIGSGNGIEFNPFMAWIPLQYHILVQILGTLIAFSLIYRSINISINIASKKQFWLKPIYFIFLTWFIIGIKFMVVVSNFILATL